MSKRNDHRDLMRGRNHHSDSVKESSDHGDWMRGRSDGDWMISERNSQGDQIMSGGETTTVN